MKWNPFTPHGTRFSDQERRLLHMRMRLWDCQAGPTLLISCALSCSLTFMFFGFIMKTKNMYRFVICTPNQVIFLYKFLGEDYLSLGDHSTVLHLFHLLVC